MESPVFVLILATITFATGKVESSLTLKVFIKLSRQILCPDNESLRQFIDLNDKKMLL